MNENKQSNKETSVFISYAREDDEPFVRRLQSDLSVAGLQVWWDREAMKSRGRTFLQEIRDAIEGVDRVICVIGPKAVSSDYVRYEWEHALLFARAILPIVRLGDYDLMPDELRPESGNGLADDALSGLHAPDFRRDERYDETLRGLIAVLKKPAAKLGALDGTPALPPHFLPRRAVMTHLHSTVLADVHRPTVITSNRQTTALCGMGGIGKSVLAAAFARTVSTRRVFKDGIVWLTVGREATDLELLSNIKRAGLILGDEAKNYQDEVSTRTRLPKVLADKVCLIVLDDVWSLEQVEPFVNALAPRCRLLITTRDLELVTALGAQEQSIDTLGDDEALALLSDWSSLPIAALPPEALNVARECGNLPLALAMVGATVSDNPDRWSNALHRLRNADLEKIRRRFPNYPYPNLFRAIQASVEMLEAEHHARYLDFAAFPEDTPIPESVLGNFWTPVGLDELDVEDLVDLFVRRSLAQRDVGSRILLHDLQLDYVRKEVDNLPGLHGRFVRSYAGKCPDGWASGPDDGYYFPYIAYHLAKAGKHTDIVSLLTDARNLHHLSTKLRSRTQQNKLSLASEFRVREFIDFCLSYIPAEAITTNRRLANICNDTASFSKCICLSAFPYADKIDRKATCHECGSVSIVHGYADLGNAGYFDDNYYSWCTNCFWSWYLHEGYYSSWEEPERTFSYKSNKYF